MPAVTKTMSVMTTSCRCRRRRRCGGAADEPPAPSPAPSSCPAAAGVRERRAQRLHVLFAHVPRVRSARRQAVLHRAVEGVAAAADAEDLIEHGDIRNSATPAPPAASARTPPQSPPTGVTGLRAESPGAPRTACRLAGGGMTYAKAGDAPAARIASTDSLPIVWCRAARGCVLDGLPLSLLANRRPRCRFLLSFSPVWRECGCWAWVDRTERSSSPHSHST